MTPLTWHVLTARPDPRAMLLVRHDDELRVAQRPSRELARELGPVKVRFTAQLCDMDGEHVGLADIADLAVAGVVTRCGDCEQAVALLQGQDRPERCPHCGAGRVWSAP